MELKYTQQKYALVCVCSLNWTFMELKYFLDFEIMAQIVFELNLYGIEIAGCTQIVKHASVWIEPLWNWN